MVDVPAHQPRRSLSPWLDRRGDFSALKAAIFALVLAPGLWLICQVVAGALGPRPWIEANHQSGLWAIRFLLLSLAVTPLRTIWRWPDLIATRRMLGLSVFAYVLVHIVTYAGDLRWNIAEVASEIITRPYLVIGFIALIMLIPLAVTSTDGMMRRMGGLRWRVLHRLVYPIAALGTVHFFWQSKLGVTEPMAIAALAVWLGLWRLLAARIGAERAGSLAMTAALAVLVVMATGLAEALYYHLKIGVPLARVLEANIVWKSGLRPAWIVLVVACLILAFALIRVPLAARKRSRRVRRTGGQTSAPKG